MSPETIATAEDLVIELEPLSPCSNIFARAVTGSCARELCGSLSEGFETYGPSQAALGCKLGCCLSTEVVPRQLLSYL